MRFSTRKFFPGHAFHPDAIGALQQEPKAYRLAVEGSDIQHMLNSVVAPALTFPWVLTKKGETNVIENFCLLLFSALQSNDAMTVS